MLAPPAQAAFAPDNLVSEMRRARVALVSASGGALADRYLRDPTGSFRRIVSTLAEASEMALPVHRGVLQARDDSAALIFIELREQPFVVAVQSAFGADLSLPGMIHGALHRSPHAHARIISIDTSKAEALPGVMAVATAEDLPDIPAALFRRSSAATAMAE